MADYEVGHKKPPVHGQIKPGEVRNPLGGLAHKNGQLRSNIKKLTAEDYSEIVNIALHGNVEELQAIIKNPKSIVLKVWVAACAYQAIKKGDIGTLETILNRAIGKLTQKVELTGADGGPLVSAEESPEERRARIKQKMEILNSLQVEKAPT